MPKTNVRVLPCTRISCTGSQRQLSLITCWLVTAWMGRGGGIFKDPDVSLVPACAFVPNIKGIKSWYDNSKTPRYKGPFGSQTYNRICESLRLSTLWSMLKHSMKYGSHLETSPRPTLFMMVVFSPVFRMFTENSSKRTFLLTILSDYKRLRRLVWGEKITETQKMNLMIRKAYYLLMILYNNMRLFIKLYSGVYYRHLASIISTL